MSDYEVSPPPCKTRKLSNLDLARQSVASKKCNAQEKIRNAMHKRHAKSNLDNIEIARQTKNHLKDRKKQLYQQREVTKENNRINNNVPMHNNSNDNNSLQSLLLQINNKLDELLLEDSIDSSLLYVLIL